MPGDTWLARVDPESKLRGTLCRTKRTSAQLKRRNQKRRGNREADGNVVQTLSNSLLVSFFFVSLVNANLIQMDPNPKSWSHVEGVEFRFFVNSCRAQVKGGDQRNQVIGRLGALCGADGYLQKHRSKRIGGTSESRLRHRAPMSQPKTIQLPLAYGFGPRAGVSGASKQPLEQGSRGHMVAVGCVGALLCSMPLAVVLPGLRELSEGSFGVLAMLCSQPCHPYLLYIQTLRIFVDLVLGRFTPHSS